jgi:integrase
MKSPNRPPKSFAVTTPAQPAMKALERLREWQGMAEGAYSANTLRAQKADGAIFQVFCEGRGESFLPADPITIRAFIEHEVKAGKKPATVRRYIATIGGAHIGAGLLNPCSGEAVRLALKKMGRETSARQAQARALGWKEIKEFIRSAGQGLRADRERALLCVAYETLARRGELVALELRDIEFWPNGTGQALIRRGKTDAEGQGRVAYLSRETVKWLKTWLDHAKISEGPIFPEWREQRPRRSGLGIEAGHCGGLPHSEIRAELIRPMVRKGKKIGHSVSGCHLRTRNR